MTAWWWWWRSAELQQGFAKKYESPEVVRFINGILGSFVREEAADSAAPADSPSPAATDGE